MSPGPTYIPRRQGGIMYPHIFSQFRNVVLNLFMTFPSARLVPSYSEEFKGFSFNGHGEIPHSELETYAAHISSTMLIRDFVTLLKHSSLISTLWITLDIFVSNLGLRSRDDDRERSLQKAANMKAAEIWLECGVLDPLRELTNVECAILNVRYPTEGSYATLRPKYAAIAEQLEDDIEAGGPMD
jgi:hypothetical protein